MIVSRCKVLLTSSYTADILFFGNWMPVKPWMLLKSLQPSSNIIILRLKPNLPWKRPTSCITFSRACNSPPRSSSPVIIRKAKHAESNISLSRSPVQIPAWGTLLEAYPSASGTTKCCSCGGGSMLEQMTNKTASGGPDDRLSTLLDRVPTALRR